ncbi:hypothetical protein FDECE_11785 [Fusarium decemcellulare]|nr:hypothetical protein FDECE_11785 [Fusarium decemcellulare]
MTPLSQLSNVFKSLEATIAAVNHWRNPQRLAHCAIEHPDRNGSPGLQRAQGFHGSSATHQMDCRTMRAHNATADLGRVPHVEPMQGELTIIWVGVATLSAMYLSAENLLETFPRLHLCSGIPFARQKSLRPQLGPDGPRARERQMSPVLGASMIIVYTIRDRGSDGNVSISDPDLSQAPASSSLNSAR